METTSCPNCLSDERVHYFETDKGRTLVTRCGGCGWRIVSPIRTADLDDEWLSGLKIAIGVPLAFVWAVALIVAVF